MEVEVEKEDREEKPENQKKENQEGDEPLIEDLKEDDEKEETKTEKKTRIKTVEEWNKINNEKPIWCRNADEVTKEEYHGFFKTIHNQYSEVLSYKHFKTEGQLECNCIIYIPEKGQMDMFENNAKKNNFKLYVKKVFIMDDCEQLVPEWLKFMVGVVDSNDIPLNVSREILQQNKILSQIKNIITKKAIELFKDMQEDEDLYLKFYNSYDKMLKLGVHEDSKNREKLLDFIRYNSLNHSEKLISFQEYIKNCKTSNKNIYYICGNNKNVLAKSPLIERFKSRT